MAKGTEIKINLLTKGYSQKQFSELIPLSESAFSNFINRRTAISPTKANKIRELLNVEFDSLFFIEGGD